MSFKEKLKEKIEKNAIKSKLAWTDKEGIVHEEEVILKKSNLPLIGDWARIYPPINEDGSINWTNLIFGGRRNLVKLLMIFGIIVIVGLGYWELIKNIDLMQSNCLQWTYNFKP